MFIKFGDKTKKIIVKNSKDGYDMADTEEDDVVYLDSDDENDESTYAHITAIMSVSNNVKFMPT